MSDDFWSNTSAISSRSRLKGLQYAVEGYIQNIKIGNEGETTKIKAKAYRSQVAFWPGTSQQTQGCDTVVGPPLTKCYED